MSSNDDPLAAALRSAKGRPRSRSTNQSNATRRTSSSTRPRSTSPKSNTPSSSASLCSFCEAEAAAVCISKSLTKTIIPLCLVHYYTTRNCRIDPKKVAVIDKDEMKTQLPYVQDLFSDAFTELQKEIATESARSFNEMAKRGSDPLSILNDARKPKVKPRAGPVTNTKEGRAGDGGFMQQTQRREVDLVEQQRNRVVGADGTHSRRTTGSRIKPPGQMATDGNPYKRRKTSAKSIWNLALDGETKSVEPTKPHTHGVTCSCGSVDVEMFGNTTSRNNDVGKAETWGTKRENDVSTRYQCQGCGKIWNEEE